MKFVDIHAHVLPRVDDGPRDLDATVELLRVSRAQGTRTIVATPHLFMFGNEDPSEMWRAFLAMHEALARQTAEPDCEFLKDIDVFLGAEHFYCPRFVDALSEGKVLPLKDTKHLLVEFSPYFSRHEIVEGARTVASAGYVPIVAHVERYDSFQRKPDGVEELKELGSLIQINAASLVGTFPSRLRRTAWSIVGAGRADIVASDAHGARGRRPRLREAFEDLKSRTSVETARALMHDNPARVLGLSTA